MEINIVNLHEAFDATGNFRLDPNHYKKTYKEFKRKLSKHPSFALEEIVQVKIATGHTPSMSNQHFYGEKFNFIKTDNVRDLEVFDNYEHKLSDLGNEKIKRTELKENDIVMTIIGASDKVVGRAALIQSKDLPANINQNIVLIRLNEQLSSEYVCTYLNSNIGKSLTWHLSRQTEQVNLNCGEVGQIRVPILSNEIQNTVTNNFFKAKELLKETKTALEKAKSIILKESNFVDWDPKTPKSFSVPYSSNFHRLDAEYYQPKYKDLVQKIKSNKNGWASLKDLVKISKGQEVGSDLYTDNGIPFTRVSNISERRLSEEKFIDHSIYKNYMKLQPKKQDILLTKDGSPGIAYFFKDEPEKMLCSAGVAILTNTSDEIKSEYIFACLLTKIVQEQKNRDVGGSVIPHWRPNEIEEIIIPLIDINMQNEVSKCVNEYFNKLEDYYSLLDKNISLIDEQFA